MSVTGPGPGPNPPGVTIRRVIPIPAQNSRPVSEYEAFFQRADGNGDGKLSKQELATYTRLSSLAAVLNPNGAAAKTASQDADINNVLFQHWDRFDTGKTGSVTLADVRRVGAADGKAKDISVKDLGGEVIYHPVEP